MNSKLLAGMIAIMTLSGISAATATSNSSTEASASAGEQDSRIIVEVDKSPANLKKSEIYSSQDQVLNVISKNVTKNFELVDRYSVLNNAFLMSVNSEDIEAIRALPEVKSVTVDKIHAKKDISDGDYYSAKINRSATPEEDVGDMVENISATTMNKPSVSNEGEGTVIAILDNEFYLRGVHEAKGSDDGHAWNHVVYKPLASGIANKFTFDNLTDIIADEENPTHAQRKKGAVAGQEGSLYFNNKVPFYYDYGGESTSYGKVGPMDYDVSSTLSYHGSHVASIASANADTYKGIAPNAQLACMKVFTNYEASETGEQMGFGDSSGAYDSAILSALEDCILLGVDGINMSLGSDLGDFDGDSITMKTLKELAADSGILTAISAGNAGKSSYSFTGGYGNWTTDMVETGVLGSYANSGDATIIASGQPNRVYFENAIQLLDGADEVIKNVAFEDQVVNREGLDAEFPEDGQHWMTDLIGGVQGKGGDFTKKIDWIYIPGFGTSADYPVGTSFEGKVVVVNRGSTSFADKYNVAVNKGAAGLIIINNDPTSTDFNFRCSFGDDFSSSIPCALALYRDKPTFESIQAGSFKFIQKQDSVNDLAKTISTFSSDGARFDFDLKPDVSTPGESIRGAVPPQKKEHREETPYSTYEYLSGTSMAAPNYAGAQSLILSKVAKDVYADGTASLEEQATLKAYRKTIDMRLMSTANPMYDASANPEDNSTNYTSPRIQGAGMVDLGKAYSTDVYLEGLDENEKGINKSKIVLKNNEDIAKGVLNLSFIGHNESGAAKDYTAKVTIMRPAVFEDNKVVPDSYKYTGEVDDLTKIPGLTYFTEVVVGAETEIRQVTNAAGKSYKDVIKITKQIEYYTAKEDYGNVSKAKVFEPGFYYNTSNSKTTCNWEKLPGSEYQSVQDVVIDTVLTNVSIPAGTNKVSLPSIELTQEQKEKILELMPYGCAIEGYVELLNSSSERELSVPFLGFYSGADVDEGATLEDAPVVEPFSFEKNPDDIYASDLVNDVAKQLVGKDNVDFGSSWTIGYAESTIDIGTDKILTNDANFENMKDWHKIGTDPATGKYFANPEENLYVGDPLKSNTMIIHQFVMRSVKDNYFTIKNSAGEVVYKSVLEDMLFGDKQLYKSHVDANYLSAGYVAHRAYAIVPLYDPLTHEAFKDGTYELEFNYQLAYNGAWVSKAYNFVVDATAPEITGIEEYTGSQGEQRVKITVKEDRLSLVSLGYGYVDFAKQADGSFVIDQTKEYIQQCIDELGTLSNGQKRLTLTLTDSAFGEQGVIIHFFGSTFSNYVMAQGQTLARNQDFVKVGTDIKWYLLTLGADDQEFAQKDFVTIVTKIAKWDDPVPPKPDPDPDPEKKSNVGLIVGCSVGGAAVLAGAGVGVYFLLKKKKKIGGK